MMLKYQKWDPAKQKYQDYFVPEDKKLKTYSLDMDEIVNCCQCLKEMRFGDGYTSLEVQTEGGFGYCVCEDCYNAEWVRRNKIEKDLYKEE